jgi:hypothetical protein
MKIAGSRAGSGAGSGFVPTYHGYATLVKTMRLEYECRVPDVEGNILNSEDEAGVLSGVQQAAAHRQLP